MIRTYSRSSPYEWTAFEPLRLYTSSTRGVLSLERWLRLALENVALIHCSHWCELPLRGNLSEDAWRDNFEKVEDKGKNTRVCAIPTFHLHYDTPKALSFGAPLTALDTMRPTIRQ